MLRTGCATAGAFGAGIGALVAAAKPAALANPARPKTTIRDDSLYAELVMVSVLRNLVA
jgi:hypothetical protein